ncbi:MAG: SGNH/GDSL hydrolase family protein [Bacteroidales bacterium]|jgi:lysophospholipase L1-like esterase|nr:SGNH/GDSL hydrolase family protein [Bacteroidales bacterium]
MRKFALLLIAALIFGFAERPTVKWVALGDSITWLNEHPIPEGNRLSTGYMKLVQKKLPELQYVNKGYNGWTAHSIAQKINELDLPSADLYTVLLGTNDWWTCVPAGSLDDYVNDTGDGTVSGAFRIIIDKFRTLNPRAKIILMTPLQRGDFVHISGHRNNSWGSYKNNKSGHALSEYAELIAKIGAYEHIPVIDLYNDRAFALEKLVNFKRLKGPDGEYHNYKYPDYIDIPFSPDDEYPYPPEAINMTYDNLHPSDKGYARIADLLVRKIRKLKIKPAKQ